MMQLLNSCSTFLVLQYRIIDYMWVLIWYSKIISQRQNIIFKNDISRRFVLIVIGVEALQYYNYGGFPSQKNQNLSSIVIEYVSAWHKE